MSDRTQQEEAIFAVLATMDFLENSREKSLVITKLQEALHWLYEIKGTIKTSN